jgi:adenosylhomocysteine nucleosidase
MAMVQSACDVGIVFALGAEQGCLEDLLSGVVLQETPSGKFRRGWFEQRSVVTVVAGPGRAAAARATDSLLVAHRPRLVVSAGFCGGLAENLKRNQIVVADAIVGLDGVRRPIDPRTLARFRFPEAHVGSFVEVERIVAKAAEKKTLGFRTAASVCEMESSAVADACAARQTPFLAVRVVSDTVDEDLPADLEPLMAAAASPMQTLGAVVGTLWRRPSSVKDLWKLKETALVAADGLAKFLAGLIVQLPVTMAPPADAATLADEPQTS